MYLASFPINIQRDTLIKFILKNPTHLETITRILFSNRRKMINKNFLKLFNNYEKIAKELNLNLKKQE